jgi:DNA-binding transcriptional regulator YhcF (GntR family)
MDINIKLRSGVAMHLQLAKQLEMKILGGVLRAGQKLPASRVLARQLKIHPNTVVAAYKTLQTSGHAVIRKGAGVFVPGSPMTAVRERDLDELLFAAFRAIANRGHSPGQIRAAVKRWLARRPPARPIVVDRYPDTIELLIRELRERLRMSISGCTIEQLAENRNRIRGSLGLVLPYHVERLRNAWPDAQFEIINLCLSNQTREAILAAAPGSVVLVVSRGREVLQYASGLLHILRGNEIVSETCLLSLRSRWCRLCEVADIVFADSIAYESVARVRPRKLLKFRIVAEESFDRIRRTLALMRPTRSRTQSPSRMSKRRGFRERYAQGR